MEVGSSNNSTALWIDCPSDDALVPFFDGKVIAQVTRLSWEANAVPVQQSGAVAQPSAHPSTASDSRSRLNRAATAPVTAQAQPVPNNATRSVPAPPQDLCMFDDEPPVTKAAPPAPPPGPRQSDDLLDMFGSGAAAPSAPQGASKAKNEFDDLFG